MRLDGKGIGKVASGNQFFLCLPERAQDFVADNHEYTGKDSFGGNNRNFATNIIGQQQGQKTKESVRFQDQVKLSGVHKTVNNSITQKDNMENSKNDLQEYKGHSSTNNVSPVRGISKSNYSTHISSKNCENQLSNNNSHKKYANYDWKEN